MNSIESVLAQKIILRNDYKRLKHEITKDKRDSKKFYYSSFFEKNKLKSSEIWKGIRELANIKTSNSSSIKLLNENNNPKIIPNVFNYYFSTIGPEAEKKIPMEREVLMIILIEEMKMEDF